ncbi:MAG TPA: zinc-dependent alcohol dehydrogenase family protein [Anaerolineaceae bacterium]
MKMKAMLMAQPGSPLVLREIPVPIPKDTQILVKVKACGVCRTDLHILDGDLPTPKLPLILGHEIIGEVVEVGEKVNQFKQGDRVGIPWLGRTCHQCSYCQAGEENLCDQAEFTGYTVNGGFAQFTVGEQDYCFKIPDIFTDVQAAPLMCAGLIGYRSFRMIKKPIRTLGIYGFGAAAHLLAQIVVRKNIRLFGFTRPGDRAAQLFALKLGAEWAGDSTEIPPVSLDSAIIFAPVGSLIPTALKTVRKGGVVVCGGIHMSDIPTFPYELLWGEREIISVANLTKQDGDEFLEEASKFDIHPEVEIYPLEEANFALMNLRNGNLRGAAVLQP